MEHISLPPVIEQPVLTASLQLNPEAIDRRLVSEKNLSYYDLQALEGDVIDVAEPHWWDLADLADSQGKQPHADITAELGSFDFWLIRFALSAVPVGDNVITWMRFIAKLQSPDSQPYPQVHSVFPFRTDSNHRIRVGPDFHFASEILDDDAIAEIEVTADEGIKVSGIVVRPAKAMWDVRGYDIRTAFETYAVVKKGKQSRLKVEFAFNVQIKTVQGQLAASARPSASQSQIGGMTYVF